VAGHNRLCHLPDLQAVYRQDGIGVQIPKYCLGVLFAGRPVLGCHNKPSSRARATASVCRWICSLRENLHKHSQQAQFAGACYSLGAPVDLEFGVDIAVVSFDRAQGEEKPLANLTIRKSLGNEL